MTPWKLVARREVIVRLTDRAFIVGTLITVAVIAGFLGWQAVSEDGTTTYEVAATPAERSMVAALREQASIVDEEVAVVPVDVADAAAARAALADGDADAWLRDNGDGWTMLTQSESKRELLTVAQAVVRSEVVGANARAAGTTPAAIQRGSDVAAELVDGDADRETLGEVTGFVFAFLFYLSALLFGVQLAGSVVEEKQNRIVEIIASAIPLRQLLAGKIVGNTVLAIIQVALYVGVGLIGLAFTDFGEYLPDLTGPVAWFLLFFVAGFVALAALWAVAGSLASRMEDLQATTTPLSLIIMAMFFGALLLDGTARVVASFVPPLSAVVMPIRIVEGGVPIWQPVAALALLVVFAGVTVLIGERLYRRSLLQTGGRVSLRSAWSAPE